MTGKIDTNPESDRHAGQTNTWARVNHSIMHDPRYVYLKGNGVKLWLWCWLLASESGTEELPPHISCRTLAGMTRIDERTATKMLQECVERGLLETTAEGRIRVVNARVSADPRRKWTEAAKRANPAETRNVSDTNERTNERTNGGTNSPRIFISELKTQLDATERLIQSADTIGSDESKKEAQKYRQKKKDLLKQIANYSESA